MIVLPAIDLKDGKCVRLYKGDFGTAQQVADDAVAVARAFAEAGAGQIHMVDLDGAISGERKNAEIIRAVVRASGLKVDWAAASVPCATWRRLARWAFPAL
jgi:phosphoribosylformimino-5-aminoimidazole carboxamide ribotide isomerase